MKWIRLPCIIGDVSKRHQSRCAGSFNSAAAGIEFPGINWATPTNAMSTNKNLVAGAFCISSHVSKRSTGTAASTSPAVQRSNSFTRLRAWYQGMNPKMSHISKAKPIDTAVTKARIENSMRADMASTGAIDHAR